MYPPTSMCCADAWVESGLHRVADAVEDGHRPVPEPLDEAAAVVRDRSVLGASDLTQKLEGGLVTSVERPRRELHDVSEQDRDVHRPPAPTLGLGERLPRLQRSQPELPHRARPVRFGVRDQPSDALRHPPTAGRQRVAVAGVPWEQAPDEPGGGDELRPRVHAARALAKPSRPRRPCLLVRLPGCILAVHGR